MIDAALLAGLGIEALLPEPLARWRPLAAQALARFLEQLPASRRAGLLAIQAALPADATPAARLVALFAACPSLHKLGQVLARHRGLPPELRVRLQALESLPGSLPAAAVRDAIIAEVGRPPGITFGDAVLAEGSVAVVLPFVHRDGGRVTEGVFKLLKPGIEAKVAEELSIFAGLPVFVGERAAALGLPALDTGDVLDAVARLLTQEIRLDVEQRNLREAADFYAGEPRLLIPALLPWCTPRLTAMQRVFGVPLTAAGGPVARRLATTLVEALLGQPFWSAAAAPPMHADLHAGNLMLADDGRVAVLDWSLVARLHKGQREALVAAALAALTLDAAALSQALATLTGRAADDPALASAADRALDRLVAEGGLPAFDWLLALLDDLAQSGVGGFGEDLVLLRKSWISLRGALAELVEDASPDAALLGLGWLRLCSEWPARLLASPLSPAFPSHLATLDLWRLAASPWLVTWRYGWRRFGSRLSDLPDHPPGIDRV